MQLNQENLMKTRKSIFVVSCFMPFLLGACGEAGTTSSGIASNPYADRAVDVKLIADSDLTADKNFAIIYGGKIEKLEAATRNYSTFKGWYTKKADIEYLVHDGSKFTAGFDTISNDKYSINQSESKELSVEIYAKYDTENISVRLIANSDISEDKTIEVPYYSNMPTPSAVEKSHNVYVGWHTEYNDAKVVVYKNNSFIKGMEKLSLDNYEINLNKETTLYADFELEKIDVTCHLPNGTSSVVKVPYQSKVERFASSLRVNGFAVSKWSTVENDTSLEHIFTDDVTAPITLYAAEYDKYYVEFVADEDVQFFFALPGSEINVPEVPHISGYRSSGYKDKNGNLVSGKLVVNACATYVATYEIATFSCTKYGQLQNTEIYTPKAYNNTSNYRHWSDTINFGTTYSIKALKSIGYTKFNLRIHLFIHSINDGYQDIFVYSPNRELYHQQYSYGEDAYGEVSFNYSLNFADLDNNSFFEIKYAASGWFNTLFYSNGNHWVLSTNIEVQMTPAK